VPDFLAYDVALGDEVYLYDVNDRLVVDEITAPTISYLSSSELRISTTFNQSLSNTVLYVKAPKEEPQNAVLITGVDIEQGSNLIRFNPASANGFASTAQIISLSTDQHNHVFAIPSGVVNYEYPVVFPSANKSWVKSLSISLHHGTGTFHLIAKRGSTEQILANIGINDPGIVYKTDLTEDEIADSSLVYPSGLMTKALDADTYLNFKVIRTEPTMSYVVVSMSLEIQKVI
jgi:hypothetical protein